MLGSTCDIIRVCLIFWGDVWLVSHQSNSVIGGHWAGVVFFWVSKAFRLPLRLNSMASLLLATDGAADFTQVKSLPFHLAFFIKTKFVLHYFITGQSGGDSVTFSMLVLARLD